MTTAFIRKNSPNPFRSNAEFKYGVNKDTFVTIEVLDTAGRVVRTLTRSKRLAGVYTIIWDGVNESGQEVANGIYSIQINVDSCVNSTQMIKMK